MKMLIIGGTVFVGRAITDAALARGHKVTLLNRGTHAEAVPAYVEHLQADRNAGLEILTSRHWDAVIDCCAYFPRQVRTLLAALDSGMHYTLISSVSAYGDLSQLGITEATATSEPLGDEVTTVDAKTYGPLKAACEQVAQIAAAGRNLIIRPGIIVGPHDPTGRFAYWVRRMMGEGTFMAPGDGSGRLQVIDVRDLGSWLVRMVEAKATGVFNAVGPAVPLTFRQMIETGMAVLGNRAKPVWVPEAKLIAAELDNGSKLPLWMPPTKTKFSGMFAVDGRKAIDAGLQLRPLAETIRDVGQYESTVAKPVLVGLIPADEAGHLARLTSI